MATALLPLFASSAGTAAAATAAGSVVGPVTAAASGAGALGGVTGAGLFASLPSVSLLSPALNAASAFGAISGGLQQAAISKAQAQQYQLQARQEELRGREEADRIRRTLQANLATQNAIFSARGISPNSGTPVTLGTASRTAASRDIETAQFNASQAAGASRSRAAQSRIEGSAAKTAGYTTAATRLYGSRDSFGSLIR